jgi:hypothetical protein
MSADNGIYILETDGPNGGKEYRVAELQAVENYTWDPSKNLHVDNPDVHITNARKMWENCDVFTDRGCALNFAHEFADMCEVLEYGVSIIRIPRVF